MLNVAAGSRLCTCALISTVGQTQNRLDAKKVGCGLVQVDMAEATVSGNNALHCRTCTDAVVKCDLAVLAS